MGNLLLVYQRVKQYKTNQWIGEVKATGNHSFDQNRHRVLLQNCMRFGVLALPVPAHLPNLNLLGPIIAASQRANFQACSAIFIMFAHGSSFLFISGTSFFKNEIHIDPPSFTLLPWALRNSFCVAIGCHRVSHMAIRCATAPRRPRRPRELAELQTSTSSLPKHCFPVQAHFSNL